MKWKLFTALLLAAGLFTWSAHATIIYEVDRKVGDGFVRGTITTDGTLGNLLLPACSAPECDDANHFVSINLTVGDGMGTDTFQGSLWGGGIGPAGSGQSNFWATPSSLLYDFTGSGWANIETDVPGEGSPAWRLRPGVEHVYAGPDFYQFPDDKDAWYDYVDSRSQSQSWSTEQIIGSAISVPEPGSLALLVIGLAAVCRATTMKPR